jgi:hypothetical protein
MAVAAPSNNAHIIAWVAQLIAAAILGMAAVPKLMGAADPIALFEALGAPWLRLPTGLGEAAAVILLIVPGMAGWGGLFAIALMLGALGSHLTVLGINYGGDPTLFVMALIVLTAGIVVAVIRKGQLPFSGGGKA